MFNSPRSKIHAETTARRRHIIRIVRCASALEARRFDLPTQGGSMTVETTSPLTVEEELGPIDIVIIGYRPDAPMTGDAIPHLLDLVDAGIIRILDVLFVHKDLDGSFSGFDAQDLTQEHV